MLCRQKHELQLSTQLQCDPPSPSTVPQSQPTFWLTCVIITQPKRSQFSSEYLGSGILDIHFSHWSKYYPDSEKDQSQKSMHTSWVDCKEEVTHHERPTEYQCWASMPDRAPYLWSHMQIQITLQTVGKCTHPKQPIHETPLTQTT